MEVVFFQIQNSFKVQLHGVTTGVNKFGPDLAGDLIMPKTKKKSKRTKPSDYFPDIGEWPNKWMGVDEDLEIGRGYWGSLSRSFSI